MKAWPWLTLAAATLAACGSANRSSGSSTGSGAQSGGGGAAAGGAAGSRVEGGMAGASAGGSAGARASGGAGGRAASGGAGGDAGTVQPDARADGAASCLGAPPAAGWTELSPSGSPPVASAFASAYDTKRSRAVLFSGSLNGKLVAQTWIWDSATCTWSQASTVNAPEAREAAALAYDSARDRFVLFGSGNVPVNNDTWEYSPATSTWTQAAPNGSSGPIARQYPALGYDVARRRVVLFGGFDGLAAVPLRDTWEWDGTRWTQVTPSGAIPEARLASSLTWDPDLGKLVLYGGLHVSGQALTDLWTWDGTTWTQLTPTSTTRPNVKSWPSVTYDSARHELLVFGHCWYDTVWVWDGATWSSQDRAGPTPTGRCMGLWLYDPLQGGVLQFGGTSQPSQDSYDQTWLFVPGP